MDDLDFTGYTFPVPIRQRIQASFTAWQDLEPRSAQQVVSTRIGKPPHGRWTTLLWW